MPEEEDDFRKISDVLADQPGLAMDEVAHKAEVSVACVRRMLDAGYVSASSIDDPAVCGRCGAKAISTSKRLCQSCLLDMDRECAEAIREMRHRVATKVRAGVHEVRQTVEDKRGVASQDRKERRRQNSEQRMVSPERRRQNSDRRKPGAW
jgi:ribosomal protein L37E